MGEHSGARTSVVAPWLLQGYLRSIGGYANTQKKKNHWVGPVAWARFLEGDMEALRASLCWSEKEPLVFPPSVRKMGSDPQGPLLSPAWQRNSHGRNAELREIPADVRAALNGQVCPLLLRLYFSPLPFVLLLLRQIIWFKIKPYIPQKKVTA